MSAAPARPARSLGARNAWMLCALLPGLALHAWRGDAVVASHLLLAMPAALAFEALALSLRRQPLGPFLSEGSALVVAATLVLYQPALQGWQLLLSLFVALVLARQVFGGLGRNLFQPVAVGLACAHALLVPVLPQAADPAFALAWLGGGVVLLALRIIRWQAPAGLLAGALLGVLLSGAPLPSLADPRWWLAAFFIAADPVTSAEDARTRLGSAVVVGALAALAGSDAFAALPFALLAGNALVPLLDARRAPRARAATP